MADQTVEELENHRYYPTDIAAIYNYIRGLSLNSIEQLAQDLMVRNM